MKKILFFLLISNYIFAQYSISSSERNALITIYNSTNGQKWSSSWNLEKDPKNWYGIKIKNGSVIEINLAANALKGNFPTISGLSKLEKLDLSSNVLTGTLSPSIATLSNLKRLDISKNNLTGDPSQYLNGLNNLEELSIGGNSFAINNIDNLLQNFSKIKTLDLSKLTLTTIPQKLSSYNLLTTLNLSQNKISQGFSLLNDLTLLNNLDLSENQLTIVPTTLGSIPNLQTLNLSKNLFTTNYAAGLSTLKNLEWLSLEDNQITTIPTEVLSLKKLIHLNLGRNKISSISGISSLINLEQLFLNHNQLSGAFPEEVLQLSKLQMLALTGNNLTGSIPLNTPSITQLENNRYTETELRNFLNKDKKMADFPYSPQRYDEAKDVAAGIGESINLTQSISGSDYTFTWFKNLDQNTNVHSESYHISNVKQEDYGKYTAEAYIIKQYLGYLFELSLFREPITLKESLGTDEVLKGISAFPNPTKDYLNIKTLNTKIKYATIYDVSGKQLLKTNEQKIDVKHLPSGVYIILIQTENNLKTIKWIKE